MSKRIISLLAKQFLTADELEELLDNEVEFNGDSGMYYGWKWFTVFIRNSEYEIYVKY